MPFDPSKYDDKTLIEMYKKSKQAQTSQQPQQEGPLSFLKNLAPAVGDALVVAGGGKLPERGGLSDIDKIMLQERLVRERPVPEGFILAGDKMVQDPKFIDPKEQADLEYKQSKISKNTREEQDAIEAENQRQEILRQDAEANLSSIEKAKEGSKYFGFAGDLPSIPVLTGDYDKRIEWESNVNRLLSQKVIDVMTQMKQASKTGATGFGQLSNKELQLLREASTALNKRLPPKVALQYLDEMEKIHRRVLGVDSVSGTSERGEFFGDGGANVPEGAAYHSKTTGKYYDEEGNEL